MTYSQRSVRTQVTIGLDEPIVVGGTLARSTIKVEGEPPRFHCSRERLVLRVTIKPSVAASDVQSVD
jgi:hypothetical protein